MSSNKNIVLVHCLGTRSRRLGFYRKLALVRQRHNRGDYCKRLQSTLITVCCVMKYFIIVEMASYRVQKQQPCKDFIIYIYDEIQLRSNFSNI